MGAVLPWLDGTVMMVSGKVAGRSDVLVGLAAGVADGAALPRRPAVDHGIGEGVPVELTLAEPLLGYADPELFKRGAEHI